MKKISIVINTYNRASVLDETLSSLYYLEYPNFEVIVVNGPSTDNTEEVLEKYKKDIKIANTTKRNLSVSRNIGIAISSGDYVAFIDDDAIPDRFWLNKLLKGFNSPEVAGVGGDVFDITGKTYQARRILSDRLGDSNINYIGNSPAAIPNAFKFIATIGVNSIYKRDILLSVGGYDEQYDYFLDETDLCARIIDAGYYINYQKGADVYHKFAPSFMRGEKKIPIDYSSIIKNIIYYCYQYKNLIEEKIIQNKIKNVYKDVNSSIKYHYKHNMISKSEYASSLESVQIGLKQGKESVERGYKLLITQETLNKNKSDFKKFPNFFNDDFSKKKTIVLLTHEYYPNIRGGVANEVHTVAIELSKRGHNIHIITCDEYKYDYPSVTFEKNIWVHRIKTKDYDFNFLRSNTPYDIDMKDSNYHTLKKLYTIYEELLNISNKYKVDIVHDFLWESLNFYVLGNDKFNSVTTLVTPAAYMYKNEHSIHHTLVKNIEKFCLENNANLVADSNCITDVCKKYYKNMPETTTIYLGLNDLSKEKIEQQINKDSQKIEILFLGRLEYRKGIDLLLEVIPDICKKYDNVVFRIVGVNTIKSHINNKKTYLEIFLEKNKNLLKEGKVIIEGGVDSVIPYYKNCDIFVAPSRFESFGFIYIEAMMFSKPTIGTNVAAIPEVIENNVTGLLFEPENTKSLMDSISKLIENKELREKMGKEGRKRYEKLFTAEIMINNLFKYYEKVIKNEGIQ